MILNVKIGEKESAIKKSLEKLRTNLNNQRLEFNKQPNDWKYLTTLSHTEKKLEELLEYFESSN